MTTRSRGVNPSTRSERANGGALVRRAAVIVVLTGSSLLVPMTSSAAVGRPDVVVIMTDDQRQPSLDKMPKLQRVLVERGASLSGFFVENALCCPSRSTFLTGRHSDATGVWTNNAPDGGWTAFEPHEPETLAVALKSAGYRTGYIGKYLNEYDRAGLHVPRGWDRWWAFSEENGAYFNYDAVTRVVGQRLPRLTTYGASAADYSTDVIARTASGFIRSAPTDQSIFAVVMPYAPHGPATPAPRDVDQFRTEPVPLNPAMLETDLTDKPAYIRTHNDVTQAMIQSAERKQWTALQAVDDLVAKIVTALSNSGRLSNTLIVFTSDNGEAYGEHNWRYKLAPYEPSIQVPFVARYDGVVPASSSSDRLASNVDLAATIADYTGVAFPTDGVSLRPLLEGGASVRGSILLEHLDYPAEQSIKVPTYCGVRTVRHKFVRYVDGFEELYDLAADPWELENLAGKPGVKDVQTNLRATARSLCPGPPGYDWSSARNSSKARE